MKQRIYLDNAATTSLDNRVLDAMMPFMQNNYGNASSLHSFGTQSKQVLDNARADLASFMGANANEIYFTSSGTESNNWALKGIAFANRNKGRHIIVSAIEHDCVLNTCKWLAENDFFVSYLPVDSTGIVDIDRLKKLINPKTILVSVMHTNNEIGSIEPIEEIGQICKHHNIIFHSDACQSFGKIELDVNKANLDLLTVNSHKIYGPKGVGALYIRKGTSIEPILHGGGQEDGLRSSTENIPGIVGFAKAAELCMDTMESEIKRQVKLRNKITDFLFQNFENVYLNGPNKNRLPGHLNFSFHGMEGETIRLLLLLDEMGIAVSAGSACSSNDKTNNASHVLQAIGLNPFEARGAIRVSIGRFTTELEVDSFLGALNKTINSLTSIFSNHTMINS